MTELVANLLFLLRTLVESFAKYTARKEIRDLTTSLREAATVEEKRDAARRIADAFYKL